jgi:hypothetical protein
MLEAIVSSFITWLGETLRRDDNTLVGAVKKVGCDDVLATLKAIMLAERYMVHSRVQRCGQLERLLGFKIQNHART